MAECILVDGIPAAGIPGDDRGLAYGDGVFRTVRVASGRALAWTHHLERLAYDCDALDLDMPRAEDLAHDLAHLFANGKDGVLKIIVTRGSGGRGYAPPATKSRRIVSAHALAGYAPRTLELERSSITLACQPRLAGVKHLNRLEQVLARAECARLAASDAWMADDHGFVIATTMRNLFFTDPSGRWFTPAITRAGIIGATRQRLISELRAADNEVTEADLAIDRLAGFSGALACNSVGGVVVVTRIDGYVFPDSENASETARTFLNKNSSIDS